MNYSEETKKKVRELWSRSEPLIDEPILPRNACLYKLAEALAVEVIALRERVEHLEKIQEMRPPSDVHVRYRPANGVCPDCQEEFNRYGGCKCNGYTTGFAESVPSL